jgi:flavin reductase (DIM6/NTAB) family NADH-FMN oxidoreductase RutF
MKETWLKAFGQMTYGIYVLTARHEETINGMIASWVSQVSFDPPLILIAVHPHRYTHDLVEKSGHFALHVIERSQKELLVRFKGADPREKFSGIDWTPGQTGCPVLKACLAWFECRIKEIYRPGNHTLLVGEVIDSACGSGGTPLCTHDYEGNYKGKV